MNPSDRLRAAAESADWPVLDFSSRGGSLPANAARTVMALQALVDLQNAQEGAARRSVRLAMGLETLIANTCRFDEALEVFGTGSAD